jgi:hypothetical protein
MAATASPAAPSEATPMPPRFWWLRRIAVGVAILFLTLGLLRWGWGVYAQRALDAEIAPYRALGQPVDPEDFDTPPPPDEQNAVPLLKKAVEAAGAARVDYQKVTNWIQFPETISASRDEIDKLLAALAPARALAREARSRPAAWSGRHAWAGIPDASERSQGWAFKEKQ